MRLLAVAAILLGSTCQHVCDATTCPTGCCAEDGICWVDNTSDRCGLAGPRLPGVHLRGDVHRGELREQVRHRLRERLLQRGRELHHADRHRLRAGGANCVECGSATHCDNGGHCSACGGYQARCARDEDCCLGHPLPVRFSLPGRPMPVTSMTAVMALWLLGAGADPGTTFPPAAGDPSPDRDAAVPGPRMDEETARRIYAERAIRLQSIFQRNAKGQVVDSAVVAYEGKQILSMDEVLAKVAGRTWRRSTRRGSRCGGRSSSPASSPPSSGSPDSRSPRLEAAPR